MGEYAPDPMDMPDTSPGGMADFDMSGLTPPPPDPQQSYGEALYTIYVPQKDNDGIELPDLLRATNAALAKAGFDGRTVARGFEGHWQEYDPEPMDIVQVVASDDEDTLNRLRDVAMGVKFMARQEAIFMTKQPIQSYLVGIEETPDMGMETGDTMMAPPAPDAGGLDPVAPVV